MTHQEPASALKATTATENIFRKRRGGRRRPRRTLRVRRGTSAHSTPWGATSIARAHNGDYIKKALFRTAAIGATASHAPTAGSYRSTELRRPSLYPPTAYSLPSSTATA